MKESTSATVYEGESDGWENEARLGTAPARSADRYGQGDPPRLWRVRLADECLSLSLAQASKQTDQLLHSFLPLRADKDEPSDSGSPITERFRRESGRWLGWRMRRVMRVFLWGKAVTLSLSLSLSLALSLPAQPARFPRRGFLSPRRERDTATPLVRFPSVPPPTL